MSHPQNFRAGGYQGDQQRLRAARRTLIDLVTRLGAPGIAAGRAIPGLAAAIDQQAAAIRDALRAMDRPPTTLALAGYAEGLRAAAGGDRWPPPPRSWHTADPLVVQLLAVCQLAVEPWPDE